MAGYRLFLIAFLVYVFCFSKSAARPRNGRDLFADFENSYDVMDKNEQLLNFPNDSESKTNEDDKNPREFKDEDKEGCNSPIGGWLC